jgi:hypothetical protein
MSSRDKVTECQHGKVPKDCWLCNQKLAEETTALLGTMRPLEWTADDIMFLKVIGVKL